jgi:DNA-binding XRE family transcriptional regulator
LVHMKRRHTELRFIGPSENKRKAVKILQELGYTNVSDNMPARHLFSEYKDEEIPGAALRGARFKENMTQKQLSEIIGIPQRHISMMENGKRPIGKNTAKKFSKVLKVSYKVFL